MVKCLPGHWALCMTISLFQTFPVRSQNPTDPIYNFGTFPELHKISWFWGYTIAEEPVGQFRVCQLLYGSINYSLSARIATSTCVLYAFPDWTLRNLWASKSDGRKNLLLSESWIDGLRGLKSLVGDLWVCYSVSKYNFRRDSYPTKDYY